jgi:protein gp37
MTKIQWTNKTWNPIVGCTKVSEGCQNCYAEKMAARLASMDQGKYMAVIDYKNKKWNGDTAFDHTQLNKPLSWTKPRMIFVCSMGDLFHESISFSQILEVIFVTHKCPQHTFQILTKRPERMREFFTEWKPNPFYMSMKNVWLGVTAENQEQADKRIPVLLQIPAAIRFVSIEPMLEPVDLTELNSLKVAAPLLRYNSLTGNAHLSGRVYEFNSDGERLNGEKLDWVICGSESGSRRRPMDFDWAVSIKDQCVKNGVPFFFKQRYIGSRKVSMPTIDCKMWDQMPEVK